MLSMHLHLNYAHARLIFGPSVPAAGSCRTVVTCGGRANHCDALVGSPLMRTVCSTFRSFREFSAIVAYSVREHSGGYRRAASLLSFTVMLTSATRDAKTGTYRHLLHPRLKLYHQPQLVQLPKSKVAQPHARSTSTSAPPSPIPITS
jgi:hypothetical protein